MIDYDKYEGHTPGKWKACIALTACENSRGFEIIADNRSWIGKTSPMGQDITHEAEANAALIADAPMLLARCKELEAEVKEMQEELDSYPLKGGL